jgi:predicted acyl esterase
VYIQGGWSDDFRGQGFLALENLNAAGQDDRRPLGPLRKRRLLDDGRGAALLRLLGQGHANNGIMKEPRIHYTTVNAPAGGEWRTAEQWPLRPASQDGAVPGRAVRTWPRTTTPGQRKAGGQGRRQWRLKVDYEPLPAPAGQPRTRSDLPAGRRRARPSRARVLKADTEVTGLPVADLWVSSTATDGPVFAYLEDIAPDGKIAMVSEGRLKASLRTLATRRPYKLPEGMLWHDLYEGRRQAADAERAGAPAVRPDAGVATSSRPGTATA